MANKVVKISPDHRAVHLDSGTVYTVGISKNTDNWQDVASSSFKYNWERQSTNVQGKKIVSYGDNNDLPVIIRNLLDDNHLAPGILARKLGLLFGEGPQLYKMVYENNTITREYQHDKNIWNWLNSFDLLRVIQMAITEYNTLNGIFVRRKRNKGVRIGGPGKIVDLEVIPAINARLGWPETGEQNLNNVKYILTGEFEDNCLNSGITTYPLFDQKRPFDYPFAMSYHSTYTFGRKFYPVPAWYGTRKWVQRSSDIADILQYLTENGITTAFHIHSPAVYWDQKREHLRDMYSDESTAQIEKRLEGLKDQTFLNMTNVLAGKKNSGKFIETVDFYDDEGNLCSWKIEPLDQTIKDFMEAQLKVSEMANSAITSGFGLHPSLSNLVVNGQLSSGSQILYAIKNFFATETAIPEQVIFEAINQSIKINFPGTELQLGFYRTIIQKEEETAPEDRMSQKV